MWLYLFEVHPEFLNRPLSERRKAAYFAQRSAFRHWQTWLALLLTFALTVGLSAIAVAVGDPSGTSGAFVGFGAGFASLHWAIYHYGFPYYRHVLLNDGGKSCD